jgi:hypothetical protein
MLEMMMRAPGSSPAIPKASSPSSSQVRNYSMLHRPSTVAALQSKNVLSTEFRAQFSSSVSSSISSSASSAPLNIDAPPPTSVVFAEPISNTAPGYRMQAIEPYLDMILAGKSLLQAFREVTLNLPSASSVSSTSSTSSELNYESRSTAAPSLSLPSFQPIHNESSSSPSIEMTPAQIALNVQLYNTLINLLSSFQGGGHTRAIESSKIGTELLRLLDRLAPVAHRHPQTHEPVFNAQFFNQHVEALLQASVSISDQILTELGASALKSLPESANSVQLAETCRIMGMTFYDRLR